MKYTAFAFLFIFSSLVLLMWILNITLLPQIFGSLRTADPPAMLMPNVRSDYVNPFGYSAPSNSKHFDNLCIAENKLPSIGEEQENLRRISHQRSLNEWTAETMTRHIDASADYLTKDVSFLSDPLLQKHDYIAIKGFKYCQMLDSSVFRRNVLFDPTFSRSPAVHNSSLYNLTTIDSLGVKSFVAFIDKLAEQVVNDVYAYRSEDAVQTEESHLQRLGCWMAVGGRNSYFQYSQEPLLHWISGKSWFPEMSWANPSLDFEVLLVNAFDDNTSVKMLNTNDELNEHHHSMNHYPLAFTILAHNNINGIRYLIEELHSPETFIMIHIDGKVPEFRKQVIEMISGHPEWIPNVQVTQNSYKSGWGLAGIVHGQLTAYFEMLDLITFEYVVNLSSNDALLVTKETIYNKIRYATNPQSNYLHPLKSKCTQRDRVDTYDRADRPVTLISKDTRPLFADYNKTVPTQLQSLRISTPPGYKFHLTEQWTILTYAFVNSMRHDPVAPTILAPLEYGFLIDELYFSLYSQWSKRWSSTIRPQNYHCIVYDESRHSGPSNITTDKYYYLLNCVHHEDMITRKWYIDESPEMLSVFRELQNYNPRVWTDMLPIVILVAVVLFVSLMRKPIVKLIKSYLFKRR